MMMAMITYDDDDGGDDDDGADNCYRDVVVNAWQKLLPSS